jgi:hypothetical protein
MKTILKYFKKIRLLKKYKLTDEKMMNDLHLIKLLGRNDGAVVLSRHIRYCELRCYARLKKL